MFAEETQEHETLTNLMQNDMKKLAAGQIIIKAEVAALLGLVQALAKQAGTNQIEGLPLLEYFVAQRRLQIQNEISATDGCKELEEILMVAADQKLL